MEYLYYILTTLDAPASLQTSNDLYRDFNIIATNYNSIRKSLDGSQMVVKTFSNIRTPSWIQEMGATGLTQDEAIVIMAEPEWTEA